jgi:nucleoid-associated protein YgaU
MYIFLSHASEHKDTVRPVCMNLRAAGFEVFFDETDLPAGDVYDDRIRAAVQRSDLFVFMLSPEAVAPGRYTLTELLFAAERWPNPAGHVLAVLPLGLPATPLPDYLKPLTVQKQVGNLAAEVLATVRRMEGSITEKSTDAKAPSTPAVEPAGATYRSLDIRLRTALPDGCTIQLGGVQHAATVPQRIAVDPAALEQVLWRGAAPVASVMRRGMPVDPSAGTLPSAEAVRVVGRELHALLFTPALREGLQEPMRRIDRQRRQGVRFVINATDAPALARLPWEFTCDPQRGEFLFADTMKPVVRWLDVDETLPTLTVQPPLRLLIAVASPTDQPALAVGAELAHLDRALAALTAQGVLRTELLEHASLARLDQALLESRPHVLHFVGHGGFNDSEGTVLFEADDPSGAADAVTGRRLAVLLRNHLQSLRLVFLNSCMGAAASRHDPFGGVAQALVGYGVPAVIAMQFPIPDASAVALSRHFYRYLAAGRPVDESLTAARAMLYAQGHEVEWGAPVLTMRTPDGRLFDVTALPTASETHAATPPTSVALPQAAPIQPPAPADTDALPPLTQSADRLPKGTARSARRVLALAAATLLALAAAALWFVRAPVPGDIDRKSSGSIGSAAGVVPETRLAIEALLRAESSRIAGERDAAIDALDAVAAHLERAVRPVQPEVLVGAFRSEVLQLAVGADAAQLQRLVGLARQAGDAPLLEALLSQLARGSGAGKADVTGSRLRATHTVRRGDTLWSIAGKRYGDPRYWPRIAQANPTIAARPDALQPGQVLRIPPDSSTESESTYRVRPGDSLWRIAARLYADGALWPRIHAANLSLVADPERILPGQALLIPAGP